MPDIIAQATEITEPPAGNPASRPLATDGFIDAKKTIFAHDGKWFVSKERAAKLCGYSCVDAIHKKADRENWDFIQLEAQGGMKKFYALDSLPSEAQIILHRQLKTKLVNRPDGVELNRYQRASKKMRQRADRRMETLRCWRAYLLTVPNKNRTRATQDFVAFWNVNHSDQKISRANLYRWDAAEKQDGISGLIDDYDRQPKHRAAWSPEAKAYLEALYLDESQRDIYSCFQNMKFMAKLNGWQIPSYTTCRRHLLKLSRDVVTYLREGSKTFNDRAFPSIQRDPESIQVGQVYVADDRLADISFGAGRQGDRIWCTVWMDMCSRKALSVVFTGRGNNTQAVLDGFYQAAQTHVCEEAYFDNGGNYRESGFTTKEQSDQIPEHLQAPFKRLFGADKIHWALPGNARSKIVERAFLEMARINDKNHPGYTGMNVLKRPEGWYLSRAEGNFLSPEQIVKNIKYFFFEIWNNWGPDGRKTPNEIWEEYFSSHPVRRADAEYLRQLLLRTYPKPIKIRTNGIQFGKVCNGAHAEMRCHCRPRFYWDESLQLVAGGIKEVWVKFSDFEPEHIWIYKLDGTPIGEVPLYQFNAVPALRAGKIVGDYQKRKHDRIKSIKAYKDQLSAIHQLNVSNPEDLMQRDDVKPAPQPAVNLATGEVIEKVEQVAIEIPLPPSIDQRARAGKRIKKSVADAEELISKLKSPAQSSTAAWDQLDNIING